MTVTQARKLLTALPDDSPVMLLVMVAPDGCLVSLDLAGDDTATCHSLPSYVAQAVEDWTRIEKSLSQSAIDKAGL